MTINLTGFPLKTCGNDDQIEAVKIVILGPACPAGRLDPVIQSLFDIKPRDSKEEGSPRETVVRSNT